LLPERINWVEDLKYTGLVEGEDYMAYRNDEELIQKMKLLIEDEDLRKKIAKSGRQKALLYHSYENRLGAIYNYAIFERKGMPR
jgi:spore maturation protein CgeB